MYEVTELGAGSWARGTTSDLRDGLSCQEGVDAVSVLAGVWPELPALAHGSPLAPLSHLAKLARVCFQRKPAPG